jgi:type VI secretion system protein ImpA
MTQSTSLFDADALLAPISDNLPCGDDTREDASPFSPYFTLKDLRNQARSIERQVLTDDEALRVPQWKQLSQEIPGVLTTRSKDLEFVAWYIEALCREHGFAGLAQGFDLARRTIELYWDDLYPQPDEEGLATRMAPLVGLNGVGGEGTLIQPILSIPLFSSPALGSFATWHAEQSAEVQRLDDDKAQSRIKAGAVIPDNLSQAVRETPIETLLQTHTDLVEAQAAFTGLASVMDSIMGDEPQPTTSIRQAMERCESALRHHAGEQIDATIARSGPPADKDAVVSAADADTGQRALTPDLDPIEVAIQSRYQALEELRRLSDFFRRTEPHSPVSYAIGQAIRWSELPLPELMQELIADSSVREGFCRVTGVPIPEPKG